jgi:hypothetical protein
MLVEIKQKDEDLPKYKIWMSHEIGDSFQHATGFQNECGECDL